MKSCRPTWISWAILPPLLCECPVGDFASLFVHALFPLVPEDRFALPHFSLRENRPRSPRSRRIGSRR